jgi:hypothetical protein
MVSATLLAAGCTDTNVYIELASDAPILRVQIEADVCSPDSIVEEVPYKILFVIDTSLSNKWNDAQEHRVQAFVDAIESHVTKDSVYFGIVTFNDYAHRPTLVFTDNQDILMTAAETLTNAFAGGGTNYEDAIHEMYQFIVDDLNAMANPLEALRTRYQVYWLSDGIPTFGTTDRATLVANVEAVGEYLRPKVGEFLLNTLYLESTGEWETEEEIAGARQLLKEMADAGGGTFTNISSGESFEFDIQPTPQIRSFRFITAVASNHNAYFGPKHPFPDSDGDGLRDDTEIRMGLDPTLADSDGDFYRDGVEFKSGWLTPDKFDPGCVTDDLDSDGDGLWDCEELVIGTDAYKPDTDGDYLLDSVEFKLDGSPLSDDTSADTDLDGVPDHAEVMTHLDPHTATTEPDRLLWAYQYNLGKEWKPDGREQSCYTLQIDNVSLYETLETPMHPLGWQTIELIVAFETNDGLGLVQFYKAEARVGFILPRELYPPTGIIEFEPGDFQPLSASCESGGPGCHLPPQKNCGDGLIDPGEECDAGDLGEATCESLGYTSGTLACLPTCQLEVAGCESDSGTCGNALIDPGEECDGDKLAGATCEMLGHAGGILSCNQACRLDDSCCEGGDPIDGDETGHGHIEGVSGCHTAPNQGSPCLAILLVGLTLLVRRRLL